MLARTTGVVGFFGASSLERLPTEVAMTENMQRFTSIPVQGEAPAPDRMEWGTVSWICNPVATGATTLTVNDVMIDPGQGHDFHKHPDRDEVIVAVEGEIEQRLERESRRLRAGDAVVIPADVVYATFNVGEGSARITVILGPCAGLVGEDGAPGVVADDGRRPPSAKSKGCIFACARARLDASCCGGCAGRAPPSQHTPHRASV